MIVTGYTRQNTNADRNAVIITKLRLPEVLLLNFAVHGDHRGWFQEIWNPSRMVLPDVTQPFVQDNLAYSKQGVLRGLHFQEPFAQAKLVTVITGTIFDVAVDVRPQSPTFGQWVGTTLQADAGVALYIPHGFAHGYQVLSEAAHVFYKCSDVHHPEAERSIVWNDPEIGIDWPLPNPVLSDKDRAAPTFAAWRDSISALAD
jgi:dTDP-4-dehydrorhamnose 3,5-epimerase